MLFAAFTGSVLGTILRVCVRIDTRLITDNVFYREKTFLRQLFFHSSVAPASGGAKDTVTSERRAMLSEKRFHFQGSCARSVSRFNRPQAPERNGASDVEEQQRIQGRL
jgi:hypothetical protein